MAPCRAACINGVQPPRGSAVLTIPDVTHRNSGNDSAFERAFASAPSSSSARTASGWFSAAAHESGVSPIHASCTLTVAPRPTSALIAGALPVRAAIINGVWPSCAAAFTSAPALASSSMTSALPFWAASASGVMP